MNPGNDWDLGLSERVKRFARAWCGCLFGVAWVCFALFAFVVLAPLFVRS